ncbi:ABC transporter permease [Sporolactobacillus nakayamae]|uniref:Oligopeptide transport system permease protein n=1 Tax=Sporolactobacillus nakayamae TaxID=269670 RepID=A0A1I2UQB5_9BACL|nr:ABC transporter permease [Sporolactobacillus nakayamae]SFG79190.1 oligopeptide transport system permease protein [Sporolactobacillus nakayamae]
MLIQNDSLLDNDFQLANKQRMELSSNNKHIPYIKRVWSGFISNKWAVASFVVILLIVLFALFAPIFSPYSSTGVRPDETNLSPRIPLLEKIGIFNGYSDAVSTRYHYFGTDNLGRDIWVRCATGTRLSLYIACLAMLIDLLIGVIYGMISGYYGGRVDLAMQRITEVLSIVPTIIVVTLLLVVLKPGLSSIIVAMILTGWINMSRIIRAQVLKIKEQEFVMAAYTIGESTVTIILKEILPNLIGPIITTFMFSIPSAIFLEAFLAFIGLGVPEPYASLGSMINDGFSSAMSYPFMIFFPIILLVLLMLSFNLFADGLRDAIDPEINEK